MADTHVVIVGAGPGGLTSAMILAQRGLKVTVFEQRPEVGGRNSPIRLGPYSFDTGPTFLMMRFILDDMFREAGERSEDHLDFVLLDPMYELLLSDRTLAFRHDHDRMREEIARHFPGREEGLDRFLEKEKARFEHLFPCLQKDYGSLMEYLAPVFLKAIPYLGGTRKVFDVMQGYFGDEELTLCFTFQSKYLGMSPWDCPAAFSMLPYIEHAYGIYHVMGGLCEISAAMARVAEAKGASIHLGTEVARLVVENGDVKGVELTDGERIDADEVIVNCDFAHAMHSLVDESELSRWGPRQLEKKRYSCSTFMLYLGLDKVYEMPHHAIVFADDYKANIMDITQRMVASEDMSFYVRNASVTDPGLAPDGRSAVYVLVPVPNCRSSIDWQQEAPAYRDKVLDTIERRTPMTDIRGHIEQEKVIVPDEWWSDYSVHIGATFSLAHNLGQLMHWRPRNKFEELGHCYLVGGGTHPGSGLPTIYESGRISANLICKAHGVPFEPPPPLDAPIF